MRLTGFSGFFPVNHDFMQYLCGLECFAVLRWAGLLFRRWWGRYCGRLSFREVGDLFDRFDGARIALAVGRKGRRRDQSGDREEGRSDPTQYEKPLRRTDDRERLRIPSSHRCSWQVIGRTIIEESVR